MGLVSIFLGSQASSPGAIRIYRGASSAFEGRVAHFKMPPSGATRRAGFTLLEMLAAVAICMTLMALLLGGMATVRRSAESAACVSNLREIGSSLALYLSENNNTYPYFNSNYVMDENGDSIQVSSTHTWVKDLLNGGYAEYKQFVCPTAKAKGDVKQVVNAGGSSYGINMALSFNYPNTAWFQRPAKATDLAVRTIIAGDAAILPEGDDGWRLGSYYMYSFPGGTEGRAHPRHNGACNILWADGSVSAVRAKDPADPQSIYNEDALGMTYDSARYWLRANSQ